MIVDITKCIPTSGQEKGIPKISDAVFGQGRYKSHNWDHAHCWLARSKGDIVGYAIAIAEILTALKDLQMDAFAALIII